MLTGEKQAKKPVDFGKSEMGAHGSGRWQNHIPRRTIEGLPCISIRDFDPHLLAARCARGRPVSENETFGALNAQEFVQDFARTLFDQPIDLPAQQDGQCFFLSRTEPHFGGYRYWLICPVCQMRRRKLYRASWPGEYCCRVCHGLAYASAQQAHSTDRAGGLIGTLAAAADCHQRAEKVLEKIRRARYGSKRYFRLVMRYAEIMTSF